MLIKLGEAISITPQDLHPLDKIASDDDLDIENRMRKFAQELKVIAPQAKDFLYFTCIMMHAAEASCLNDDGTKKKTASGEDVVAEWVPVGKDSIKWVCNDPNVRPYANSNKDIFPRFELKKAYKNWVGKPLCLDHKSNSVDHIRGVIVDTVYDDKHDRIIALCALDKKNYGDLSDKVRTGVAASVSMGVAVGRAVCSDCHTVAKTERDFCQHMRAKSCYGEINLDLSPIELSLVVNGADPKAKVKHIVANDIAKAATLLTDYLQLKEASKGLSTQDLESIKKDLEGLNEKVNKLISSSNEDSSDAVGPTRSTETIESNVINNTSIPMNVPEAFPTYASELQIAILGAQTKLASLQENLLRISNNEEPTMTKKNAFFQGTEEPKPGQVQYEIDPLNEQAREMDKTLVGKSPFPGTGDVNGMYPGDAELKKELQRLADEQERAMFREAALKKAKEQLMAKGFYQGTEEPTPGKKQYKVDPLEEKARKEDKQMVGEKPFPEVGKVDGLYDDDLKTKEKLLRASLKAKFEKVAQPDGRVDKSNSRWVVYANEKPILAATVAQITKDNSENLYDAVATKRFGESLLNRIKTEGFQATAASILKSAQTAPVPAPVAAPEVAAPVAPEAPAAAEDLLPPENVGGEAETTDEIVSQIDDLAGEIQDKIIDLQDKISGPVAEDAKGLEGVMPAGDEEFVNPAGEVAPKSASQLQSMRKRVNAMLQEGIKETIDSLNKYAKELRISKELYKSSYSRMSKEQKNYLNVLTASSVKDARATLADTEKLESAVIKYAYGTAELEKRASAEAEEMKEFDISEEDLDKLLSEIEESEEMVEDMKEEEVESDSDDAAGDILISNDKAEVETSSGSKVPVNPSEVGKMAKVKGDLMSKLSSKEARAEARVKLAQKGLSFNELSDKAHPAGSADLDLDSKTTVPAKFLVLEDLKDAMLDVANTPPKVKKQAELIQQLVSEGKLEASKVDELVAHGVDADAVKYWKSLWSAAKDSTANEFASKLTQEHSSAKQAQEMEDFKAKVKRAYETANQMVSKGFISEAQVSSQAEDILKWNDEGFENFKKIINRQPNVKQASVPVVGLLDSGSVLLPAQPQAQVSGVDVKSLFDNYFAESDRNKGIKF